jgi:predicted lipoprotein with Yx(FWY)xxD motif
MRLAATLTTLAATTAVAAASPGAVTVVHAQATVLGPVIAGTGGRTLYHDGAEGRNVVKCAGSCALQWPPLLIAAGAKPVAGPGLSAALLGTVKRPDGKLQVTFHGMPLYLFAGDRRSGDVNGQGQAGMWHVIAPTGAVITKTVKSSTSSKSSGSAPTTVRPSGSSSSSSSSSGSGSSSSDAAYCAANPMGCINGVPITGA